MQLGKKSLQRPSVLSYHPCCWASVLGRCWVRLRRVDVALEQTSRRQPLGSAVL